MNDEKTNWWVGNHYANCERRRLLLLGESAYDWTEDNIQYKVQPGGAHARELIEDAIDKFTRNRSFSDISRTIACASRGLVGKQNPEPDELERAWHEVAFRNYVPGSVGDGAQSEPMNEHWNAGRDAFRTLLNELQPQNIIVFGHRLWRHMPDADLHVTNDVQGYRFNDGQCAMCWVVTHPTRMAWQRLNRVIRLIRAIEAPLGDYMCEMASEMTP